MLIEMLSPDIAGKAPDRNYQYMKNKDKSGAPAPRIKKKELQDKVMKFLEKENKQSFNYKQIAFAVGATHPANRMDIINLLDELTAADIIQEVSLGKYKAISNRGTENVGLFVRRSNGRNGVMIDDELIMVAERNSMHALNGDKVKVEISARRKGQEPEAKVIEIIEPKDQVFIGTLNVEKDYAALVTDSKFLAADIIIPRSKLKGGKSGDKAIARIVQWRDEEMNPRGEVVDILGRKGRTPPRCMPFSRSSDSRTSIRRPWRKRLRRSMPESLPRRWRSVRISVA